MNDRLKALRKALDLNQTDFGTMLGVTPTAISILESGKRNLTDQMLLAVCRAYNVNEDWLRTGAGEMFKRDPATEIDALAQKYGLSEFGKALIVKFASLSKEQQQAVEKFFDGVYGRSDSETAAEIAPPSVPLSIQEQAALLRARADALEKGSAEFTTLERA